MAALIIGAIYLIQRLLVMAGDPMLFDKVPVRYIFDCMDLGILAAFLTLGTVEAVVVFKEQRDE